jgi:hypothetical protein
LVIIIGLIRGKRSATPMGEVLYWASQVGLFTVALIALLVARNQIKAFATFELMKMTYKSRLDREYVLTKLRGKPFSDWSDNDRKIAGQVCASYDMLGHALRSGYSSAKFFIPPGASSDSGQQDPLARGASNTGLAGKRARRQNTPTSDDGCRRVLIGPRSSKPTWSPWQSQPGNVERANNSRYGPG